MRIFRARLCGAAAVVSLLAGPAYAQNTPKYGEPDKAKTQQEIAAEKAAEEAYKNSLGNIPDKGPTDPWGNVRSENAPKPAAKATAAKPKTKIGTTAK